MIKVNRLREDICGGLIEMWVKPENIVCVEALEEDNHILKTLEGDETFICGITKESYEAVKEHFQKPETPIEEQLEKTMEVNMTLYGKLVETTEYLNHTINQSFMRPGVYERNVSDLHRELQVFLQDFNR